MHPSLRLPCLVTTFAALLLAVNSPARAQTAPAASTAPAKTYKVNLSPALKVGQKLALVSDITSDMNMDITISAPGMPAPQVQHQKQAAVVHLEGDCEVLAVTAEGGPKKLAVTVKALKATQNGSAIPGLPNVGDKIIAERISKKDKTLTVGDKPLSLAVTKLLKDSIPADIDGQNDQIMFGPNDSVAVGATWAPNPSMLADVQESLPSASGIDGSMKLESMQGGGQVAKVSGTLNVLGATLPLPPPMNNFPVQCTVQLNGTFPTMAKGAFDQSMKMDMKCAGDADAGGAHLKIDMTATQSATQTVTLP